MDMHNDLDWSAFCYLSGDLSASETAVFEALLASDQPAREALARAVEMAQAVASAERAEPVTVAPARKSSWSRRLSWMSIGAAAALLVAVFSMNVAPRIVAWRSAASQAEQVELAAAWNEAQRELAAEETEADVADQTDELDLGEVPEAPSWMAAALASQSTPRESLEN